jgi:hypothetical protein
MCCRSLILFGFNMIFSLSTFEDSTTLGSGILSIEVLSADVSTLGGGVLMVSGLSMIAVLIAVRSLTDLLILFTLGAVQVRFEGTIHQLYWPPMFLVSHYFCVFEMHIPSEQVAFYCNQRVRGHIARLRLLVQHWTEEGD